MRVAPRLWRLILLGYFGASCTPSPAPRESAHPLLPIRPGFTQQVVADGFNSPVAMTIAPDGRIFVCEQVGRLRVIEGGVLREKPFLEVDTFAAIEQGLIGVTLAPDFPRTPHLYVCFTTATQPHHNRIVRYDVTDAGPVQGSERDIFRFDRNIAGHHVGGAMRFGLDGKLYASSGDNGEGNFSQSPLSTFGKIVRIDPDGSIPEDNPFYATHRDRYRAIWARGFANAFTFDVHPATGRMFINDVGGSRFEEINEGVAGANYGWPLFEGPGQHERFTFPLYSYGHDEGCAITGGVFYAPAEAALGAEWVGRYFFADFCRGEIRWVDPDDPAQAGVFGTTAIPGPVDLRVGPDGALYGLARGNFNPVGGDSTAFGAVIRIVASGSSAQ